ncbi:ABC transporter ATP-binding protein [Catellatospora sp. NPDC049609]|uniref:ABC transporter ATP-binding protein n=1 Tax=Catellatospora sp. NPDC049609 TaxID=3155505 RepID=UPI00344815B1
MLELAGVTRDYGSGVVALRDVSLTVERGELVGIVGPSGSGKSTLLHVAGVLDRPTAGRVTVAGHDTARLSDRQLSALRAQHIGFVFQQFHLAPRVPALDNVADGLLYSGVRRAERRERAAQALHRVDLGHRLGHAPHEMSGGERQRVAIARAIVSEPEILYADEPTGNLDSVAGDLVMGILSQLRDAGTTVVIITHDREIAAMLPRQITLRDGRIVPAQVPA